MGHRLKLKLCKNRHEIHQHSRINTSFAKAVPDYIKEMYSTFADVTSCIDVLEIQAYRSKKSKHLPFAGFPFRHLGWDGYSGSLSEQVKIPFSGHIAGCSDKEPKYFMFPFYQMKTESIIKRKEKEKAFLMSTHKIYFMEK